MKLGDIIVPSIVFDYERVNGMVELCACDVPA